MRIFTIVDDQFNISREFEKFDVTFHHVEKIKFLSKKNACFLFLIMIIYRKSHCVFQMNMRFFVINLRKNWQWRIWEIFSFDAYTHWFVLIFTMISIFVNICLILKSSKKKINNFTLKSSKKLMKTWCIFEIIFNVLRQDS